MPDVQICSTAGVLEAGADCDWSGHAAPSTMGMAAYISWLEDSQALCMSSKDFAKQKIAMEQLCVAMGDACSFEIKQNLAGLSGRVDGIVKKAQKNK